MHLNEIMIAILDGDAKVMREAFVLWIDNHHDDSFASCDERYLNVMYELCYTLADDVHPMPIETCQCLAMPIGSTYARGADKFVGFCRSVKNEPFIQPVPLQ